MKNTSNLTLLTTNDLSIMHSAEQALGKAMRATVLNNTYTFFSHALEQQLTKTDIESIEAVFSLLTEKISNPQLKAAATQGFFRIYPSSTFFFLCKYAKLIHLKEVADFFAEITEKETTPSFSMKYLKDHRPFTRILNKAYSLN